MLVACLVCAAELIGGCCRFESFAPLAFRPLDCVMANRPGPHGSRLGASSGAQRRTVVPSCSPDLAAAFGSASSLHRGLGASRADWRGASGGGECGSRRDLVGRSRSPAATAARRDHGLDASRAGGRGCSRGGSRSPAPTAARRRSARDDRDPCASEDEYRLSRRIVATCRYPRCACLFVAQLVCDVCRNWWAAGLVPVSLEDLGENCSWFRVRLSGESLVLDRLRRWAISLSTFVSALSRFATLWPAISCTKTKIRLGMACAFSTPMAGACRRDCVFDVFSFETAARVLEKRFVAAVNVDSRGSRQPLADELASSQIALDWDFEKQRFVRLDFGSPERLVDRYIEHICFECVHWLDKLPVDAGAQARSVLMLAELWLCRRNFVRRLSWSSFS